MTDKETQKNITKPKTLKGVVVSTSMKDTVVVSVETFEKHPRYKKYIRRHKRFHAHDAGNTKIVGDRVVIVETKPISKLKRFKLV